MPNSVERRPVAPVNFKALVLSRQVLCGFLLAVFVVFGGGGSPAPIPELICELTALVAIVVWSVVHQADGANRADRLLVIGICLFVLLPILQLIPLPPAVWRTLPGRDGEVRALALVGRADYWRPISLAPFRTLASLLSLIPPLVTMWMAAGLTLDERTRMLGWICALTMVSAFVGLVQVESGDQNLLRFYEATQYHVATGFQANRNAFADLLHTGLLAGIGYLALRPRRFAPTLAKVVVGAVACFLVLTVILTGSRAGSALLVVVAVAGLVIGQVRWSLLQHKVTWLLLLVPAALLIALSLGGTSLDRTWHRFEKGADARPGLWVDTRYAADAYWPVGAGLGSFQDVFPAAERLEAVDTTVPNRAHEDYLEFALETGLAGMLSLAAIAAALLFRGVTIVSRDLHSRRAVQALCGLAMLLVFALHSLVDYPMRSMSLASLAAFAIALLSLEPRTRGTPVIRYLRETGR